jgi:class 3 adenylate cyclase/tetratricopeptide (TPR) repeat protein
MRCAKCGTDNREGRKFCASCGTSLAIACPKCGTSNLAGEQFCGECGAALNATEISLLKSATTPEASASGGERRHLTILFCDLVGSVTLTSQLDPEEWRATVAGYQRATSEAITGFGGEVVRYVGDGIMAFFGYPVAHDNDAERAARAGLAIIEEIGNLNERQSGNRNLSVRIGIDSGSVVIGIGAGHTIDAFGDAANIAARVQSAAEPDTVVVSDATRRLISGLFIFEERGAQTLKGIEQRVQLYRVIRPSGIRGRFEAAAAAGNLTRFVGREDELRSLLSRWARARDGDGQVVTISGEAGIGKSRLVRHFREEIGASPHLWLQAGAGAFFQSTPFYPVAELLHQLTDGGAVIDPIAQLESALRLVRLNPAEAIPLLAPLLNLSASREYPPSPMSPEQQRRRLLATLVEWLLCAACDRPLVVVIEDLHWIDPSTLELIHLLVEQGATAPLLLLYTARPEFRPPWPQRAHHLQLTLDRLSLPDVRTIVSAVAADRALTDETVATLVERTGGVPLFVEELTRAVMESGGTGPDAHTIPASLHDSLMARLDRLGPAKEVMQIGAVIGRDFSYELLHAVHPIDEAALQQALRSLSDAELVYARGVVPEVTYQFKHALIRDAAYEALLKSRRKELHLAVARSINARFPTITETHPEVLARHWTEAGDGVKAVQYLSVAGEQAATRAAHAEAIAHFSEALDWLERLPTPIDEAQRCSLLLELGREQRKAGEPFKAQETLIRSAEVGEALGDCETVVNVALELTRMTYQIGLPSDAALRFLGDMLRRVGPADSILRAKILGGLAIVSGVTGGQAVALDYAEQGIAMSRRLDNAEVLELALQGANYALQGPQDLDRRLANARERAELSKTLAAGKTFRDQLPDGQIDLAQYLMEQGDIQASDREFAAWTRLVELQQRPFEQCIIAVRCAARALMRGDFAQSEKLAQQALEIGQRLRADNVAGGVYGLQMFALERERGRLKELEPLVRMFVEQNLAADTWRPGLAVIYSELDRPAEATAEFERLTAHNFKDIPRDSLWMATMTFLADVCIFLGDKLRAAVLYNELSEFDGRNVIIGYEIVSYGALSRYLGTLATTLERWDDAIRHFEDALTMNARMEAWPWLAHTQFQYAKMLLVRRHSIDRERAFALLDAALATARRLGMRALEERASALLNRNP